MTKVDTDKLKERYLKAKSDYQAHLKRERTRRKKQKVKDDTERENLAGKFLLSLVENGEWPRERFLSRLDGFLADDRRRALFGLPPIAETPEPEAQKVDNSSFDDTPFAS